MQKVSCLPLQDFLNRSVKPRRQLYGNWCKERTATLISGQAGAGKSFFVETLAVCISGNCEAFGWKPKGFITVGLFDGENDDEELQERLTNLGYAMGVAKTNLHVLTRSMIEAEIGRSLGLSDSVDQTILIDAFTECQLIIVDNLNCCFDLVDENSSKDWEPVQSFIFKVRQRGKALILVHHTPKSNPNSPAGNSKNVRVFDNSFLLFRTEGTSTQEAKFLFVVHKSRSKCSDLNSFEAHLTELKNELFWIVREASGVPLNAEKEERAKKVVELHQQNLSLGEIESSTGIPKSSISRILKQELNN